MKNKLTLWIPVAIVIASVLLTVFVKVYEENKYENWTVTEGTVVYTEPSLSTRHQSRHLIVYYSYTVGEAKYEGIYRFYEPNIPDELNGGDSVEVWYNPNKPKKSYLVDPKSETSYNILFIIGFMISIILLLSGIDIISENRKKRK